ncbi:acetyltransferase [Tessaracoccus sp. Y36]
MPEQVVVIGASGFGRESLDTLEAMIAAGATIAVRGVIDDAPSDSNLARLASRGVPYLGTTTEWLATRPAAQFVLAIGAPGVRRRLATRLEEAGLGPFSAVHPSAHIGVNTTLGAGTVVCAGSVISTNVQAGAYVHINPNATIGHDALLEDYVSVNPAAVLSGEVHIQSGTLIGAGAVVLQGVTVGEGSILGAGTVATKNVPSRVIVKGIPGRWTSSG